MIDAESPVRDPSDFVGHAGLVRRLFSRIGADRPQSVAVIGGHKSGKTSLLAYVSDEGVRKGFLDGRFVFARVSSGRKPMDTPDSFLSELLGLMPDSVPSSANPYESLSKAIEALHASGKRLVVLLDDFHFVTRNERFPLEFFSFLRSMANNFNLAYVTTSFLELQKLCVVKDVQESPFFNIFTNIPLVMLSVGDAKLLLVKAGMKEPAAARVVEWCGPSAYALKKAAARLDGEDGVEKLTDEGFEKVLLKEIAPFFELIVSSLSPKAMKSLQGISRGRGVEQSEAHFIRALVTQGFLNEREGEVSCFSPAFLAFLRKSLSSRMLSGGD
jgi:hypothetical protein